MNRSHIANAVHAGVTQAVNGIIKEETDKAVESCRKRIVEAVSEIAVNVSLSNDFSTMTDRMIITLQIGDVKMDIN